MSTAAQASSHFVPCGHADAVGGGRGTGKGDHKGLDA